MSVVATTAHCTLLMIKLCCCVWAGFCVVSCVDILQISFPLGTIKLNSGDCFGASAHSSYIKVTECAESETIDEPLILFLFKEKDLK